MRNYESDAYRKYRSSMEQRQKVVRTSGSPYSQQTAVHGKRQIVERSASTKRKRTREKGKPYYDYDLLLVIIFLMCFGLVMLYSSSAYSAQNDYNNDMFFFTRQAIIGIIGFIAMFIVSKIDYHLYGAYAKEFFWFKPKKFFCIRTIQMIVNLRNDKHCNKSDNTDNRLSCKEKHIIIIIILCTVGTTAVKHYKSKAHQKNNYKKQIIIIIRFSLFSCPFTFCTRRPFHYLPFPMYRSLLRIWRT